jgi:hypothetical protein
MFDDRAEHHCVGRHGLGESVRDRSQATHNPTGVLRELPLAQGAGEHVEHVGINDRAHCFHEITREGWSTRHIGVQDPDGRVEIDSPSGQAGLDLGQLVPVVQYRAGRVGCAPRAPGIDWKPDPRPDPSLFGQGGTVDDHGYRCGP